MRRWLGILMPALLAVLALLAGCGGGGEADRAADAVTLVLENEAGDSFTARLEGPRAWLFLADGTVDLPRVESANGVKFSDGVTTFWSMGQEAMLTRGAGAPVTYVNNRSKAVWEHAKLDGADFRATGNEPGWDLEVREGESIRLTVGYGAESYRFPAPEPVTDAEAGRTVYTVRHDGHTLEVELTRGPCNDTMADETYETAVRVVLDGKEYEGCGRALH